MLRIFSLSPLTILKVTGKCISNLSILDQYFYSIKLVSEEQETSSFARFLYQIVTRWVFVAEKLWNYNAQSIRVKCIFTASQENISTNQNHRADRDSQRDISVLLCFMKMFSQLETSKGNHEHVQLKHEDRTGAGAAGGSVFLSCCRIFASEPLLGLGRGGSSRQPRCLITPCSHPLSSAPHVHMGGFPCPGSCCIFQIHSEIRS